MHPETGPVGESRPAPLTPGQCAALACLLEATAPKPGNVHRGADFEDLGFADLAVAAVAIAPFMDRASEQGVGSTVLAAVRATRQLVRSNANLGIILLLTPLASVPADAALREGILDVLSRLTEDDAAQVYEAIRIARPGGMGVVSEMDIAAQSPRDLLAAMRLAEQRDLVARQYVCGFEDVFERVANWLVDGRAAGWSLSDSIVRAHVRLMAEYPDSLIARKCGPAIAQQSQALAKRTLESGRPGDEWYESALADLDFWLRSDGHRRNPGTSADLIAAGLFVGFREGTLSPPWT
jgi:triphosphoribosyl-dephospho-CoA synthase